MSKWVPEIIGGLEIAAGVAMAYFGDPADAAKLVLAGAGTVIGGLGTLLSKGPVQGFSTAERNPVAPWRVVYGRQRVGGSVVYINEWPAPGGGAGGNDTMLDMVIVLAAHSIQSIDALLFDMQRVQISTRPDFDYVPGHQLGSGAMSAGPYPGTGTSFTPVQQNVGPGTGGIPSIQRLNGVVTISLNNNIPYLIEGDHIQVAGIQAPYDTTLNGTFQVEQIISQVFTNPLDQAGSIVFTVLNGGQNTGVITGQGQVNTLWANYGRTVYFEPMLGGQSLGQSFNGMIFGTPLGGDSGDIVSPDHTGSIQGQDQPNPWTSNCSLLGKSAVHLRLQYNETFYKGGLPQISFLVHGKNDIYDPRNDPTVYGSTTLGSGPPTSGFGYSENAALCIADFLTNQTWGYKAIYGTDVPLANLIAAANTCDEKVALAYSLTSPPLTEPAYALNGQFTLETKRGEILQNMLTACGGRLTYVAGQYIIWPAAWLGNSFAIGANPGGGVVSLPSLTQIAAGPIKWKIPSIRELYNGVKGTFISQANKWQSTDFPPYAQDTDHGYSGPSLYNGDINLAYDNGERRWLDIQLPFTISYSTAQRLAKIELLRRRNSAGNPRLICTLTLNMVAYQIATLDLLTITWAPLNWVNEQFEVIDSRLAVKEGGEGEGPRLVVELDIAQISSDAYEWSPDEELSPEGYIQPLIPGLAGVIFIPTEQIPGYNIPYPWEPGYASPLIGDSLFPGPVSASPVANEGKANFGLQVTYGTDTSGNPTASVEISGTPPPNQLSAISPPQVTYTAGTGGSLPAGRYVAAASAFDATTGANSALGTPVTVTVGGSGPVANNGSIALTIAWPPGSNGGEIYLASLDAEDGFYFQATLTSSQTSFTIVNFDQGTTGAPDNTFDHLAIAWKRVIHGGVWAQQVQAVTSNTITIGGAGMTANQWAGYTLSLLGKLDSTQPLIILNMSVQASGVSSGSPEEFVLTIGPNSLGYQLPDLTTLLVPGDLVVMRFKATFTSSSFSDPNIANPYYPYGAASGSPLVPIIESGHIARVVTGIDAGDTQAIEGLGIDGNGNYTIVLLAGEWAIQPADGDIVIIEDAAFGPEYHTPGITSPNRLSLTGWNATIPIANLQNQTWLFIARSQDANNDNGDDTFAPVREIFVFGSQGTRTITSSQTMQATDRIIDANTNGGNITYTLLPFDEIANQSIFIQNTGNGVVTVQCQGSDTLLDGVSSLQLVNEFDRAFIVIPQS